MADIPVPALQDLARKLDRESRLEEPSQWQRVAAAIKAVLSRSRLKEPSQWQRVATAIKAVLPQGFSMHLERLPKETLYRSLARIFHPDKAPQANPDLKQCADTILKALILAHQSMAE
jgi:hypothetical protein